MTITDERVEAQSKIIDSSFAQEHIDVVKVKEVILFIHSLPPKEKKQYEALYNSIGDKLFINHVTLSEYQQEHFKTLSKKEKVVKTVPQVEGNFEDQLRKLIECCHHDLEIISKCLILKFGNDKRVGCTYILLHDTQFKPSVFSSVKTKFGDECDVYSVDSFIDGLESFSIRKENNYIVILVLNSNPTPESTIIPQLNKIRGFLAPIEQINLIKGHKEDGFYKLESDFSLIENEVKYLVSKELKDIELNNEIEKILKKLFGYNMCSSLQYKKISKGYSGSSVFYIRPSGLTHTQVKFIVKVGETAKSKGKIELEITNFKRYVDSFTNSYHLEVERTERCIAIRYNYASKDSKIDSLSFSESYHLGTEELIDIINALFDNPLFKEWNSLKRLADISFETHYKSYINVEHVKSAIAIIKSIGIEEVEDLPILNTFRRICSLQIPSYQKVCHGDLHSENFFIDGESNVFLIDFGDTDIRHSIIDYTTLECSIKFRHIPRFIENQDLYKIEEELLELDSFQSGYNFINVKRFDLIKPYKLITKIRSQAISDMMIKDTHAQLEYLYSLYMITIRQIQYDTMNQLYAIKSAELVGNKILSILGEDVFDERKDLLTL